MKDEKKNCDQRFVLQIDKSMYAVKSDQLLLIKIQCENLKKNVVFFLLFAQNVVQFKIAMSILHASLQI